MYNLTVLNEETANEIMLALDTWKEDCLNCDNVRVNNSFQVQLYDLIRNIHRLPVVPDMPNMTYDMLRDPNFDPTNDDAEFSSEDSIWYALGFYLARYNGNKKSAAHALAAHTEKSIRSGMYNLQSQTIGTKPPLYITSHKVSNRDIQVVTFNPFYELADGTAVHKVATEKVDKRWESALATKIAVEHNISKEDAKKHVKHVLPAVSSVVDTSLKGLNHLS